MKHVQLNEAEITAVGGGLLNRMEYVPVLGAALVFPLYLGPVRVFLEGGANALVSAVKDERIWQGWLNKAPEYAITSLRVFIPPYLSYLAIKGTYNYLTG